MSVRSDLALALADVLDVPVYESLEDHVEVPSVLLYPAAEWVTRNGYDGTTLNFTATAVARRADRPGAYDSLEAMVLAMIAAPIGALGATFTTGGAFRIDSIAGVEYLVADLSLTVRTPTT